MPDITIAATGQGSSVATYIARPIERAPRPAVLVLHNALGMSQDLRNQVDWLAACGFVAAAPNLLGSGRRSAAGRRIRRAEKVGDGETFDEVEAVRRWLEADDSSTGRVGLLAFGGVLGLWLAASGRFRAASISCCTVPPPCREPGFYTRACPIVASFGRRDRAVGRPAEPLRRALEGAGIEHDVCEYKDAGHAFLNDHHGAGDRLGMATRALGWLTRSRFDVGAATDARSRTIALFDRCLRTEGVDDR